MEIQREREARDETVQREFTTKRVKKVGDFPHLSNFPYPIQRLLVSQIHAAEELMEDGDVPGTYNTAECHCLFFRRYNLPCKHLFHHQLMYRGNERVRDEDDASDDDGDASDEESVEGDGGQRRNPRGTLTKAAWERFEAMFAEGAGYDVWFMKQRVEMEEEEETEAARAARRRRHDFNEALDALKDYYFRAEEYSQTHVDPPRPSRRRAAASGSASSGQSDVQASQNRTGLNVDELVKKVREFTWQFHGATYGSQV